MSNATDVETERCWLHLAALSSFNVTASTAFDCQRPPGKNKGPRSYTVIELASRGPTETNGPCSTHQTPPSAEMGHADIDSDPSPCRHTTQRGPLGQQSECVQRRLQTYSRAAALNLPHVGTVITPAACAQTPAFLLPCGLCNSN